MEKILFENPWVIILILVWTLPWKGAALWRAARRGHIGWFLTLIILNTLAVLDILYLFIFSNWGLGKKQQQDKQEKQSQENRNDQVRFSSSSKSRMTIV